MTNEDLVREIKQGNNTTENLEQLYLNNKGYIYKIAIMYKGYCEIDDLIQEGFLGLYNAIEPYDETQGNLFLTYAGYRIQQKIGRYIEDNCKTVRIPVHLFSRIQKYKKVINSYKLELGREPGDEELCAHLRIDFKALEDLKRATYRFDQLESLDEPVRGSEDGDLLLSDSISDSTDIENSIVDSMMENRIRTELWEIVKDNTTEEENKVITERYRNNATLEATGQSIGESREKARQLEYKALRKLRYPRVRRQLEDKFEANYARAYRGGFGRFNNSWTSITEEIALKNLELDGLI